MTQVYEEDGAAVPVTVLQVGPCVVTRVKTDDGKDGYNAVQIAFEPVQERKLTKPVAGNFKQAGAEPHRHLREFRCADAEEARRYEQGQSLDVTAFEGVDLVDVQGRTKGRGYTGVVKRWGFKGAKEWSHGTHEYFRHGGAIGASAFPARVHKNKRNQTRTAQSLRVVRILPAQGCLLVGGSVPGPELGLVVVQPAVRKPQKQSA